MQKHHLLLNSNSKFKKEYLYSQILPECPRLISRGKETSTFTHAWGCQSTLSSSVSNVLPSLCSIPSQSLQPASEWQNHFFKCSLQEGPRSGILVMLPGVLMTWAAISRSFLQFIYQKTFLGWCRGQQSRRYWWEVFLWSLSNIYLSCSAMDSGNEGRLSHWNAKLAEKIISDQFTLPAFDPTN